ncbi:MAG: glycosyltransferase [Cyanobacteria bacterium HKST-UBA01]|nr:glycosyltransferase [Cyanobacteria bacterium HKST-UBA01]
MDSLRTLNFSVILPVCNQSDHIESVVRRHIEFLQERTEVPFEIILVVNGCTDDSLRVCRLLEENLEVVRVVDSERAGWGAAVQEGMKAAGGSHICYASSARAKSEDIVDLINCAASRPDVVVHAIRKGHDNPLRSLSSYFYNLECRVLHGIQVRDVNGNPKIFPRKFERLLELEEEGYLVDVEFNVVCTENDYPVVQRAVRHTKRHGGKSMTGFLVGASLYFQVFNLWLRRTFKKRRNVLKQES